MNRIIKIQIDETGKCQPMQAGVKIPPGRATLLLPDAEEDGWNLLSEAALAGAWLGPEE